MPPRPDGSTIPNQGVPTKPNHAAGPSDSHGTPKAVEPSPESIPYITVPSMLASQPGDEYAFASPDAYNAWRQSPNTLPPRPPAPVAPHLNPAFAPNFPRPTRVDHWHAGLNTIPARPLTNGLGARQASAGPSNPIPLTNGHAVQPVRHMHQHGGPNLDKYASFPKATTVQKLSDIPDEQLEPPRPSSYVPPHLRSGPPSGTSTPTSFSGRNHQAGQPPPPVALPQEDYLALSRPSQQRSGPDVKPKVLVMDLNGAIIYRSGSSIRQSYPRPYLSCLLDYLFLPEPLDTASTDEPIRPWSVFVWSSAQPHNVRSMVEMGFGPKYSQGVWQPESKKSKEARAKSGEGRLLGVWARDKMGLSESDYKNKVQTFKDLRKVAEHLSTESEASEDSHNYHFDLENTVLLDDSPIKARYQPWNQLVIPEYDRTEFNAARTAAALAQARLGRHPEGMDCILLAIIGMLEEMRTIGNVPAWIRGGGLTRLPKKDKGKEDEESVDEQSVDESLVEDVEPKLEDLPSHEDFKHWYEDQKVVDYWIHRGKKALERKGIPVVHGIDSNGRSPSPAPDGPPVQPYQTNAELRQRRWSPSRPVSPSYDQQPSPYEGTSGPPTYQGTRATSPFGPFGRRGFATMSEALPPVDVATLPPPSIHVSQAAPEAAPGISSALAAADPSAPASGPSNSVLPPLRPSTARPSSLGRRDQRWRTFTASEVSQYLIDLADRSIPVQEDDGEAEASVSTLKVAADILKRHHQVDPRRQAPQGPWNGELCVKCLKYLGGLEGGAVGQVKRQAALEAGFSGTAGPEDPAVIALKAEKKARKKARKAEARATAEKQMAKKTSASGGVKGKKKATAVSVAAKKQMKKVQANAKAATDPNAARKKSLASKGTKIMAKGKGEEVDKGGSGVQTGQLIEIDGNHPEAVAEASGQAQASGETVPTKTKKSKSGQAQAMSESVSIKSKKSKEGSKSKEAKSTEKSAGLTEVENAEAGPSTPRRTLRPTTQAAGAVGTEDPSPRRSNPRRSATNVDAIRAEARFEAQLREQARTSPTKRVKAEPGSPSTRRIKIEL